MTLRIALFLAGGAGLLTAQMPGFGGMGGGNRAGVRATGARDARFRLTPYATLQGTYTGNLTLFGMESEGRVADYSGYGAAASAGVVGHKGWRKSLLALGYNASGNYYSRGRGFQGPNQILTLGYTRELSDKVELSLSESAGMYSNRFGVAGFGGFLGLNTLDASFVDPNAGFTPANEIFDTKTYYAASSVDLAVYATPKLSFGMGGSGFLVRRKAAGLAGVNGAAARADVTYQAGRNQSIGLFYGFMHAYYNRQFGSFNAHGTGIAYGRRIGRYWDFDLAVGGYRFEALAPMRVTLDPVVAAVLGQSTAAGVFYGVNYGFVGSAGLTGAFRHSSVTMQYSRGISPGNGVYLGSRYDAASIGYGYGGLRDWSLGFGAGYARYKALMQSARDHEAYRASASLGRRLTGWMHFTASGGVYGTRILGGSFDRMTGFVSVGLAFTPGDIPVALW